MSDPATRPAMDRDDLPVETPTEDDICRLEKAAWDSHADRVLVWYRDQIARLQAERDKFASQAREISMWLADAGIGAMPIPEGVKTLLQRAEQAEAERDSLKTCGRAAIDAGEQMIGQLRKERQEAEAALASLQQEKAQLQESFDRELYT